MFCKSYTVQSQVYFCIETGVELIDRAFVALVVKSTRVKSCMTWYMTFPTGNPSQLAKDQPDLEVKYDELESSNIKNDSGFLGKNTDGIPSEWNNTSLASQIQRNTDFPAYCRCK